MKISVIYKDLKVKESTELTKKEEEHIETPLYFFFYINSLLACSKYTSLKQCL